MAFAFVAATALISSCKEESLPVNQKKDTPVTPPSKLKIMINSPSDSAVCIYGKEYDLSFSVTSVEPLKNVYLLIKMGSSLVGDTTFYPTTTSFNFADKFTLPIGSYTFVVRATNNKDSVVTKSITFEVSYNLTESKDQVIYHRNGSIYGAYDLKMNELMSVNANKGIVDLIDKGYTAGSFNWAKKWGTGNATTFIKANTANYNFASTYTIEEEFKKGGTPSTSTDSLVVGDIYILKNEERFPHRYIILKVTKVEDKANSENDLIEFSFKK